MITISQPLPVKENIYTQLSSVRRTITISEPLPVKENTHMTAVYICSLLQEVVLILLSFVLLKTAVCVLFNRKWF
jgi:hypothetical protein